MSLSTMVYDGVFERFPALRVATVESMGSWVGEWIERFEYRYQYMRHTSQMKRPIREYFARNIWINADPSEKLLPLIVQFVGDEKFFAGSDYPHAEGFAHLVPTMRTLLSALRQPPWRRSWGPMPVRFMASERGVGWTSGLGCRSGWSEYDSCCAAWSLDSPFSH